LLRALLRVLWPAPHGAACSDVQRL